MKEEKANSKKGFWGSVAGVSLIALGKFKWLLPILKFTKVSTIISMLISVGAYGLVYGWAFGASIVYLLFVHELGHYIGCKMKGIPVKPTLFIPFLGAAVRLEKMPTTAAENAFIAYMGPVFGVLSVVPAVVLYMTTHSPLWLVVISMGCILNLFNLIPFGMLDGGKIVGGISPKLWFVGLILIVVYVIWTHSPIAIFIAILGIIHLWSFYRKRKSLKEDKEMFGDFRVLYQELTETKEDKVRFTNKLTYAYDTGLPINVMVMYEDFMKKVNEEEENINILEESRYELEQERFQEAADEFLKEMNEWLEEHETYIQYMDSHNATSTKSKWTTFAIYLALIVVLSLGMDISTDMVKHNAEASRIMHH